MKTITGSEEIKYNVVDADGFVILRASSRVAAERFIETLDESVQSTVRLLPVVDGDRTVLFG